jgi:hypothetical protein
MEAVGAASLEIDKAGCIQDMEQQQGKLELQESLAAQ